MRPRRLARQLRRVGVVRRLALALTVAAPCVAALASAPARAQEADDARGVISGVVLDQTSGEAIEGALVIVQCACMQGAPSVYTNADGLYQFPDLPAGNYTVQVLHGESNLSKVTEMPRGAKLRVDFRIDPSDSVRRVVVLTPNRTDSTTATSIDMETARDIPVGGTSRDFTSVVDMAPTASRDQAGIRLAGTGGDESKYQVDGANISSPSFGTVGATIVQEFISTVDVLEAGYDAEFGGASGGIVRARRISGSNRVRGLALVRYTPRLADPRLILNTDEALRASVVTDHIAQVVLTISGPIVRDKLFFAFGVGPAGNVNSLIQTFYHRIDKDRSGGFANCPYRNGQFDCVEGGNFIQTRRFAEQRFSTGAVSAGYFGRLDWVITPKHTLTLSGGGGPRWDRTSYRIPNASVPNTFGTNPAAALGGASRVATGVVNDNFGTTLSNATQVGLSYSGRVLRDTLEIDAGVSYFQSRFVEAWKLDNPEVRDVTLTQKTDTQGRDLFEFLDRDGALNLVPGVDEFCNDSDLPGLACPVRTWLSGGLGQYNDERSRRGEGYFDLTHFFGIAGTSHQLKYGGAVEHVERVVESVYSGANDEDFYNNCPAGQLGGGEWCYDPEKNEYEFYRVQSVNNNRLVTVNTDNPNNLTTIGYGRVRVEQDDLRAIATANGQGIRVQGYSARLTTQNYAAYLQDRVQLLPNLYVSAGVRWEVQDMRDVLGNRALLIWDNVAPRAGITYDWTEEGKSRLYASYGHFYRPLPLQLNSRVFGGLVNVTRTMRKSDCSGTVTVDGVAHAQTVQDQPTQYCTDANVGTSGLTAGSVVPRLKGQFNRQFQVGYDQEIIEDLLVGVSWIHNELGRAVEDVSTNGGSSFLIANPGEGVSNADVVAQEQECQRLQTELEGLGDEDENRDFVLRELNRCVFLVDAFGRVGSIFKRPTRNFDAWTLRFHKRFARNWTLRASYTYSRLLGNYDGSVDRDTGAINLGASTQYDIPALVRNSFGPLFANTPHVIKLDGFYQFNLRDGGRLTLGSSFRFSSGTPVNLRADNNRYSGQFLVFVLPRGAGGRTQPTYSWNVLFGYAYPLPGEFELEFTARLLNVTNAKAILRVDEVYSFSATRPVAGATLDDLRHVKIQSPGMPTAYYQRLILQPQGNFGVERVFQQPFGAQFELRLRF